MNADELMVDDWIENISSVEHNDMHNYEQVEKVYSYSVDTNHSERLFEEFISPIPITTEILEKNGLHNYGCDDYGIDINDGIVFRVENKYRVDNIWAITLRKGYNLVRLEARYVHELQHAIKLCKINKEIIL